MYYENNDVTDGFIDIPDMPPLEGDEEVKEGLKILTPNKLLIRFQISLA